MSVFDHLRSPQTSKHWPQCQPSQRRPQLHQWNTQSTQCQPQRDEEYRRIKLGAFWRGVERNGNPDCTHEVSTLPCITVSYFAQHKHTAASLSQRLAHAEMDAIFGENVGVQTKTGPLCHLISDVMASEEKAHLDRLWGNSVRTIRTLILLQHLVFHEFFWVLRPSWKLRALEWLSREVLKAWHDRKMDSSFIAIGCEGRHAWNRWCNKHTLALDQ